MSHRTREALAARFPVHVTVRLAGGLPGLRGKQTCRTVKRAFAAGCDRFGFRLAQYSVQSNLLHMICEGRDKNSLARGTPREVRNTLCYVLNNARRHAVRLGRALLDPFGSGFWFDGWTETRGRMPQSLTDREEDPPLARARSWLLLVGWRRRGLLGMREVPAAGAT